MTITICENLKKLRKDKGNTQEELAAHLGISMQAVSKWERGEGYPDITLLPAIALYYNVTTDQLLGMEQNVIDAKIEEYIHKGYELSRQGKDNEKLALWREAQKEFPNNFRVLSSLMYTLDDIEDLDEKVKIGERLLNECTDNQYRYDVMRALCCAYGENKDWENAKKYAEMAPSYLVCQEVLYSWCIGGEEGVLHGQHSIRAFIDTIYDFVKIMCNVGNLSVEEKIKAYEFALKLFELLYEDGNFGYEEYDVGTIYFKLAGCHASLGDTDKALSYLEIMPDHIIKFSTQGEINLTSPMVNRLKFSMKNVTKHYTCSYIESMLGRVEDDKSLDCLRNDERYSAIIDRMKKYAVK
jgi:transcriptional regulator with XRE-family HTH domain